MKKFIFFLGISFTLLGIAILPYAIINTSVSKQYETRGIDECISAVSGQNLCLQIDLMLILLIICIAILIYLLSSIKKFFNKNE